MSVSGQKYKGKTDKHLAGVAMLFCLEVVALRKRQEAKLEAAQIK